MLEESENKREPLMLVM